MSDRELGYTVDELGIDQGASYFGGDTPGFTNTYERGYGGGRTNDQLRNFGVGIRRVTVAPGDNIQDAVDSLVEVGGGIVELLSGTHNINYNINLSSGVYLFGETVKGTIIDFGLGSFGVTLQGTSAYSTGTVSISNGGVTVTGGSTAWLSNISAGQSIFLGGAWYPVVDVATDTSLTIAIPYFGTSLSGATYIVASYATDVQISTLTIQNSASTGLYLRYTNDVVIEHVDIIGCATGLQDLDGSLTIVDDVSVVACNAGIVFSNIGFLNVNVVGSLDTLVGDGMAFSSVKNCLAQGVFVLNSAGDGMKFTDCDDISLVAVSKENTGQGFELVSGNTNIIMLVSADRNGSDGIRLTATSDACVIYSSSLSNNTGYGVNVAASSCDNNIIHGNVFTSNTAGANSDSGTATMWRDNQGVADSGGTLDSEGIADIVGAMVTGNTETNITVTYQDSDNTLDFAVPAASETTAGVMEVATAAEVATGTDDTRAVTPAKLGEGVADIVGAMVTGNTETNITVTYQDTDNTLDFTVPTADTSTAGVVELAIASEVDTGTDATRAVTPDALAGSNLGESKVSILVSDPNGDALTTGNGKAYFRVPSSMTGMNLVEADASVSTVSSSGAVTVMIRRSRRTNATTRADADMLSTAITIDQSEFDSEDATGEAVNGSNDDVQTGDHIYVDVDAAGTGVKGLCVSLVFRLP